jgi:hypothetical protein
MSDHFRSINFVSTWAYVYLHVHIKKRQSEHIQKCAAKNLEQLGASGKAYMRTHPLAVSPSIGSTWTSGIAYPAQTSSIAYAIAALCSAPRLLAPWHWPPAGTAANSLVPKMLMRAPRIGSPLSRCPPSRPHRSSLPPTARVWRNRNANAHPCVFRAGGTRFLLCLWL